jgi:hypothetical protein
MILSAFFRRLPARMITLLITTYRVGISPLLSPRCRFAPTCSEFALEAVRRHGAWTGSRLALARLLRCHPWGGTGYDPVPCRHDLKQQKQNRRTDVPTLEA